MGKEISEETAQIIEMQMTQLLPLITEFKNNVFGLEEDEVIARADNLIDVLQELKEKVKE